ncbi:MAG: hypothetical protein AAFR96_06165 [Planctomycetota bacterium]
MRTVLLLHNLPDRSSHVDWLFEIDEACSPRIPTFRLADRPDLPGVRRFEGVRLADHRRRYLDYQGDIGGGRGSVSRVAAGCVELVSLSERHVEIRLVLDRRRHVWSGVRMREPGGGDQAGGAPWRFEVMPDE